MPVISAQELSEKLQKKLQADQQAGDDLTKQQLEQHARRLKRLSSDALSTTRDAIQEHSKELTAMHQISLQRLRWMLLWPILTSACLALLMIVSASLWSWWTITEAQQKVTSYELTLQRLTDQFCKSPAGQRQCK